MAGQTSNYQHLLFLSPWEAHSFPLKSQAPAPFSLVQDDVCYSFRLSVWIPGMYTPIPSLGNSNPPFPLEKYPTCSL